VKLQIANLKFAYNPSKPVLRDIDMQALPGKITALLGPNAAGKSTLLKCIAGILRPEGRIMLDGRELNSFKKEDITRDTSYLPQDSSSGAVLTVFEVVLLGRLQSLTWRVSKDDLDIVLNILEELSIHELALRLFNELSGGQKQMVSIAQALVRQPRVLLLDEPMSNLDIQHEIEILDLIRDITVQKGITTVITFHDLNLAARYADKMVILKDGKVYAAGEPKTVLTPEMMRSVYGVNSTVRIDNGTIQITPLSSVRSKVRAGQGKKRNG